MPALLERDAQRAELGELLRDLALGHGALVLVEGPAGIGKTEVLHLAQSMAASHELEALQGKGGELVEPPRRRCCLARPRGHPLEPARPPNKLSWSAPNASR